MIPGMNPRMMKQAMKKMGMQQEDIEASEVIIKCPDKEIIIPNPSVAKVKMMGQETWQITGEAQEKALDVAAEINDEDIKTVSEQTGASEEDAKAAIEKHDGDLAAAIMELKN
ncbi:nascent polypeptide-associated complex protein [Candidatus Woesearchaeota archaeon]|nr:nascent polypeptide-associated complex protein [Candidatus Woesearchaeota archaeon]